VVAALFLGTCIAGCTSLLGDFGNGSLAEDGGTDATTGDATSGDTGTDASTQTNDAGADASAHTDAGIVDSGTIETSPSNPCANAATGTPCGTGSVCSDGGCV